MDDLHTVLGRVFPGREPTSVETVHRGNHKRTAVVAFPAADRVVVQLSSSPAALRTEAALARAVRARTSVPTPRLLAAGTLDEVGYVVAELVSGTDLHATFTGYPSHERRRIARSFGRYLAELHDAFAFEAYGSVVSLPTDVSDGAHATVERDGAVDDGVDGPETGHSAEADTAVVPAGEFRATGPAEWGAWFVEYAHEGVSALPAAFDDLRAPLRAAVDDASFPTDPPARLFPWDLRPGNALAVDGRVSAVLDWGSPLSAAPGLSVAKAEHLLADWYVDRPARLRAAFRDGYESRRTYPSPTRVERTVAVVRAAVDSTGAVTRPGFPERTGADAVAFHRSRLRELL